MRLLTGMSASVDGQGAALDEAFRTSLIFARIRSLLCVYAIMPLQIRFAIEALQPHQLGDPQV